jgi:molybdate transport system ATP-binding protein
LLDPRDIGVAISAQLLRSGHVPFEQALWLRADHVLLAAQAPRAMSARNVLAGEISAIAREESGSYLVELATGAGTVLSRLTDTAVQELGLTPGKKAWALVKAHSL